jgi:protease I
VKFHTVGIEAKIMNYELNGKKVAILVTDGFEQIELVEPRQALIEAGASTYLVSPLNGEVQAWSEDDLGAIYSVDVSLKYVNADDFDALVLPGGVESVNTLCAIPEAISFVRQFFAEGKPVAAIGYGPKLLIEADVIRDRGLTSFYSLRRDVANAGAIWRDKPVVTDHSLITCRCPEDIPLLNEKMIEEFADGYAYHVVWQESAAYSH